MQEEWPAGCVVFTKLQLLNSAYSACNCIVFGAPVEITLLHYLCFEIRFQLYSIYKVHKLPTHLEVMLHGLNGAIFNMFSITYFYPD